MPKAIEIPKGKKINRLTCTGRYEKIKGRRWYIFECECGSKKSAQAREVLSGKIMSCGCLKSEIIRERCCLGRGEARRNGVYNSWANMISRCGNQKDPKFKDYGGRGIKVCKRWLSFDLFYEDMGDRPSKGHSVGRINNNGNYEPNNCRWESPLEQANNTRRNRFINYKGERMTVSQAARIAGLKPDTIYQRLNSGMSEYDATLSKKYNKINVKIKSKEYMLKDALECLSIPQSTYYKRIRQGFHPQEIINSYSGGEPLPIKDGRFRK